MTRPLFWVILIGSVVCVAPAWAGSDEEAVERVLVAEAKSAAAFAETRDTQTVLKVYTADYSGVQDGETETRETIEKWLSEYGSALDKGSRLYFISAVSNLNTEVAGSTAWATYDYVFQAIRNGELEAQDTGKCTSLLRKDSSAWRIFHEHCSKSRPAQ
jgi:ketosteroid isomerase-like protein